MLYRRSVTRMPSIDRLAGEPRQRLARTLYDLGQTGWTGCGTTRTAFPQLTALSWSFLRYVGGSPDVATRESAGRGPRTAALHGPAVNGRKAILFAFLDDHCRLFTGYRWARREDTVRLEAAVRTGIATRGIPASVERLLPTD
jgi:hypothetical protein